MPAPGRPARSTASASPCWSPTWRGRSRFYRDTLGFFEIDSGDGSAVLASGDTRLVLRTVAGLSAEAGRLIYLNLEVGDVEAVYARAAGQGRPFVHDPPRR